MTPPLITSKKFERRPYPELHVSWKSRENGVFALNTPWIHLEATAPEIAIPIVEQDMERLRRGAQSVEDIAGLQGILSRFDDYPISFVVPRSQNLVEAPSLGFCSPLKNLKPSAIAEYLKPTGQPLVSFRKGFDDEAQKDFVWDLMEVKQMSSIEGQEDTFDPMSVLSVLRWMSLRERYRDNVHAQLEENLKRLSTFDSQGYRTALCCLLRQNHFVTSFATDALRAASQKQSPARDIIAAYAKSEIGHDRLTGSALQILDVEPEAIPVNAAFLFAINALHFAARQDVFAFACLISYFEGIPVATASPLARHLKNLDQGGAEAAKFIDKHRHINASEKHALIPDEIAMKLPALNSDQIKFAAHLLELVTRTTRRFYWDFIDSITAPIR